MPNPNASTSCQAGKDGGASWRILPPDETEIDGAEVCTIHSFTHDPLTIVAAHVEENPLPRAHLIAAAPDLYEALGAILANHEIVGAGASIFQCTTAQARDARAALAKARGKQ